jgi:hypothetical protein
MVWLSYANPFSNFLPQAGERVIVPSPVYGRGLGRGQLPQLNCHAAGKSKTICFAILRLPKLSRTFLHHIRINTIEELKARIIKGIDEINASPVVFRWNKFDLGVV